MWGWLIALAVVAGIAILPLGISAKYDSKGALIRLIAGPVRLTVFPTKKKEKKEPKKAEQSTRNKSQKSGKADSQPEKSEVKGGSLAEFVPLMRIVLDFLGDFRKKLRVDRLELKLVMAGDDPCDLAVNYGRAWAAVGNLFPLLERAFVIKKRNVEVECDFTSEETLVVARLDLTLTLGRLLSLGVRHGVRTLREYLKIMNFRKGGALK